MSNFTNLVLESKFYRAISVCHFFNNNQTHCHSLNWVVIILNAAVFSITMFSCVLPYNALH